MDIKRFFCFENDEIRKISKLENNFLRDVGFHQEKLKINQCQLKY